MSSALAIQLDVPSRAEWLEQRRLGIGGSDIAGIVGMSRYESPLSVYLDKLGLVDPKPESFAMSLGRRLEPVILDLYREETGFVADDNRQLYRHPRFPFVVGTPDATAFTPEQERRVVECKAPGFRQADRWGDPGTDEIPDEYLCQVAWYMAISGLPRADVAALIGGRDFRVYTIERNLDLEAALLDAGARFWHDHVEKQVPPPLDGSDRAREYIEKLFPENRKPFRAATDTELQLALQLKDVLLQKELVEEREKSLRNQLTNAIGEAEGISGLWGYVSWKKPKDSHKTDWKAVVEHINPKPANLPALVAGATKVSPGTRRFLPKFKDLQD